ncbi:MAG: prepilin-type N-terminal cleavage/methylation domain-containing protein [Patescibacteria group bacterium]
MNDFNKKGSKGFSLIEILIALFVFSVTIASVFMVSFGNQTILMNLKIYEDSLSVSQFNLEEAKARGRFDFENLESGEEINEDIQENLEVSLLYDYTKEIKSKVRKLNIDLHEVELPLYVSNWRDAIGGDTCFRRFENSENYEILQTFPLDVLNEVTDIDVVRGKAYITIDSIISPNFLVVDVSDVNNPEFISNNFGSGRRLVSLKVAGKYAYLATGSTARQLQILNVENPASPQILSEFRLPEPSSTTTQSSIFYKDKKIYLGSEKNNWGKEFHIINVSTPSAPQYLGSFRVDTKVNAIAFKEDFAFVAVPNPTPLRVLDTGNYQNIQSINSYEAGGLTQHGGQTVAINDNLLAFGRSVLSPGPTYHEIFLFDVEGGGLNLKASKRLGFSVRDLILRDNILIVASTLGTVNKIHFLSLDEDNLLDVIHDIDLPGKPVAFDCEDDKLYVLTSNSNTENSLVIIGKNND